MGWIKRANQYGKYRTSWRGFRIYIRRIGNTMGTQKYIGVNRRGQIVEGADIEEIGFNVDKVCLLNELDARDAKNGVDNSVQK